MVLNIKQNTIFASLISYRDPVCTNTLTELFKRAEYPENVFVGICQQNNEEDSECIPEDFKYKNNIRIIRLPSHQAKGPAHARYLCSTLWDGEQYYLQIDSHSKFTKNWDTKCINMIKEIKQQNLSQKPVISSYPTSIEEYQEDDTSNIVPTMCRAYFTDRNMISIEGAEHQSHNNYYETPYLASGFFFCEYTFLLELPYDPNLDYIFIGEEIEHAIRFYTHGYNIFTPNKNIIYHEYTRADKPKIWTDQNYRDDEAFEKIKYIIGLETDTSKLSDKMKKSAKLYGLGNVRSLQDYYNFAGIDVKNKIVYKDFCKENKINPKYKNYILDGSGSIVGVVLEKKWWPKYCIIYTSMIIIIMLLIFCFYKLITKQK